MASPFDDIFGGAGPQWTWEQMQARIDEVADQQRVPRELVHAVIKQESNWDPHAVGDGGRAKGFFQLHPGAASDAGIDPAARDDIGLNIYGGIRYLRLKLDQAGGDVDKALRLYNGGGDPNYVANVRRHLPQQRAQPTLASRAASLLSPASAEAATAQQGTSAAVWDDIFGAQAPAPAMTPRPPTARSTPEEDAAYRQWAAQQPAGATTPPAPVSQTAPPPAARPGASQTPPGPTPAEEQYAAATLAQMRQRQTPREPVTDPAALLAGGAGQGGVPPPVTDPAALLAVGGGTAPPPQSREQQLLAEAQARQQRGETVAVPGALPPGVPSVEQETLEEGITRPSTMIPLLMPGAGAKAVTPLLKQAGPLITRGARAAAEGLSQTAGWTVGRTAETGEVPSPSEIGTEAAVNVATGGVVEIPAALRAAKNAALRATPGAQILLNQRAVQEAEGLGKRVFNAQDKAVVSKAFDAVAATGEKLDVTPVRTLWHSLTPTEQRIAGNELSKISSTFADALKTKKLGDWDIGELQHLRSELRTASMSKRTPETQDLLQSLRASVDEAIHHGMVQGSLPAAELIEAQKAYRKVMQAEDLQGLVTKHTKDSPNLKWQELNLAALNKDIRGGGSRRARELVKGMDTTERQLLMQELESLKRHYPFVQIPRQGATMAGTSAALAATGLALTGNLPAAAAVAVPAILAAAARSPNVMSLFKRSIIEGKGRLAGHHVDALLNAIRHENEGETPSGTGQ